MTAYELRRHLLQKQAEEIRSWFKDHKAMVLPDSNGSVVRWAAPGTGINALTLIFRGYYLIFIGDLGDAVFHLTWQATPTDKVTTDLGYFLGKLSCSSAQDLWEEKLVAAKLNDLEKEEGPILTPDELIDLRSSMYDCNEFRQRIYDLKCETDTMSDLYSCGELTHPQKQAYLIAWQMISTQLQAATPSLEAAHA